MVGGMSERDSRIDVYRAKAANCFERAKRLDDHPGYQEFYRDLAIKWLALAAEADSEQGEAA
jgi:hypothetical protein